MVLFQMYGLGRKTNWRTFAMNDIILWIFGIFFVLTIIIIYILIQDKIINKIEENFCDEK